MRRFASILVQTADFRNHADIALLGILNQDYTLRLVIENDELELQTQDNQTWTPSQRPYVPYTSTTETY